MPASVVIILRILHIVAGVFWVGAVLFVNLLLGPSVAAAGPEGAKVMQELNRRAFFQKIIMAATITILAGLMLIWNNVNQAGMAWFGQPFGRGISTGMLLAIVAYVIGVFMVRPAMMEMMSVSARMIQASGPEKETLMGQVASIRGRLMTYGKTTVVLLILAVSAMAAARYM